VEGKDKFYDVRPHEVFEAWFKRLKKRDSMAHAKIFDRLTRIEDEGHFGECRHIDGKVWELKFRWGPGYRVYYMWHECMVVILLCGGNKAGQVRDIEMAKQLSEEVQSAENA